MKNNEFEIALKKSNLLYNRISINAWALNKMEEELVAVNLASWVLMKLALRYLDDFTLFSIVAKCSLNFYNSNKVRAKEVAEKYNEISEKNKKYARRVLKIIEQAEYMRQK